MRSLDGFDAHIVETHHSAKKDAPSGTAIALGKARERRARTGRFRSRACAPVGAGHARAHLRRRVRADLARARGARPARVRRGRAVAAQLARSARQVCSPCAMCWIQANVRPNASRREHRRSNDRSAAARRLRNRARHAVHHDRRASTSARCARSSTGRSTRASISWCRAARTGEAATMTLDEHRRVVEITVEQVDGARSGRRRRRHQRHRRRRSRCRSEMKAAGRDAPAAHVADVQQAAAARHRRALPRDRRRGRPADRRLQRARPHGEQHRGGDDARAGRAREHRRREGSVGQPRADRRDHPRIGPARFSVLSGDDRADAAR